MFKKMHVPLIIILLALIGLAACAPVEPAAPLTEPPPAVTEPPTEAPAPTAPPPTATPPALDGTNWNLIGSGDPAKPTPPLPGSTITLDFDAGQAGGSAGCNFYGGAYTLEGNQVKWGEPYFTVTEMACQEPLMQQETDYMAMLQNAETLALEGERLVIQTLDGTLIFEPAAAAELEGTTWFLQGIVKGEAIMSLWLDENITLAFEEGSIGGSAGCNQYNAGYELDGSSLTLGPIASTMMACEEDVMQREIEFLAALGNVAGFEVTRETLTLLDAKGQDVVIFHAGEPPEH